MLVCCQVVFFTSAAQEPSATGDSFALVELFTSEGCSACPGADSVLNTLSNERFNGDNHIIALAYHVDYWNHLGWKDPFSRYSYTIRQENYSRVMPDKEMFTPEMIVNGSVSFTGSDAGRARKEIRAAFSRQAVHHLSFRIDSLSRDSVFLTCSMDKPGKNIVLRTAVIQSNLSSKVVKGENAGRVLHHNHVVRVFYSFDRLRDRMQISIPLPGFVPDQTAKIILFIQEKKTMRVLAACEEVVLK